VPAFYVRPGRDIPAAVVPTLGPKRGVFASGYFVTDEVRSSSNPQPYVNRLWFASRAQAELACGLLNKAPDAVPREPLSDELRMQVQSLVEGSAALHSLLPWRRYAAHG